MRLKRKSQLNSRSREKPARAVLCFFKWGNVPKKAIIVASTLQWVPQACSSFLFLSKKPLLPSISPQRILSGLGLHCLEKMKWEIFKMNLQFRIKISAFSCFSKGALRSIDKAHAQSKNEPLITITDPNPNLVVSSKRSEAYIIRLICTYF